MKAVVYRGPRGVRVDDAPDPRIEGPTGIIVRRSWPAGPVAE